MAMRVAIIGCGLIGHKRARALPADVNAGRPSPTSNHQRAQQLAAQYSGCEVEPDWQAVRRSARCGCSSSSRTINDALAAVTLAAVRQGKHVLVEKPAARSAEELQPVLRGGRAAGVVVKVGFNHRFHPAFLKAREIVRCRRDRAR